MNRHIYKKPEAAGHARDAATLMAHAMEMLGRAETKLELSGWRGAAHGIHQAKLRVNSWRGKVYAEIDAIGRGEI